jgi:hypothetical protein
MSHITGLGVRETTIPMAFGYIGVSRNSALALSLLFGLITLAGSLLRCLFFLVARVCDLTISPATTLRSEKY